MRVIGYKKADFTAKDGKDINGYHIVLAYKIKDDEGFGYYPLGKKVWISQNKFESNNVHDIVTKCVDVEPVYNMYGKFDSFRIL